MKTRVQLALVVACLAANSGCSKMLSRPTATPDPPIGHVALEENRSYLIDARTESCILEDLHWALHVDCAKLKENVPEAAKFITWELKPVPPVPPTP